MVEVEAKLLIAPFATDMSAAAKFVVASFEVNVSVIVASLVVEPLATALPPDAAVIAMVGAVSSWSQLNCVAAELVLPYASVNPPAPTSMVVAPSSVAVKVAV